MDNFIYRIEEINGTFFAQVKEKSFWFFYSDWCYLSKDNDVFQIDNEIYFDEIIYYNIDRSKDEIEELIDEHYNKCLNIEYNIKYYEYKPKVKCL